MTRTLVSGPRLGGSCSTGTVTTDRDIDHLDGVDHGMGVHEVLTGCVVGDRGRWG